ncbi:unnamed protein product [Gongylonema pulchrum]|uniref:Uncharacterized protein n=1 Tax=Gongylonema pulchrum TaxID=637853 RepID=A0A183DE71_9BILA|nr:unnamed protein product [Gongylonema pulchrum]
MPTEISQSRLAGRHKPSNACTIIVVKLAEFIYREGIVLKPPPVQPVNPAKPANNFTSRLRITKWPTKIFCESDKNETRLVRNKLQVVQSGLQLHELFAIFSNNSFSQLIAPQLLNAFVNAIIEGNEIHEQQMARRHPFIASSDRHAETFTIPQVSRNRER